jgi:hypothetical protein
MQPSSVVYATRIGGKTIDQDFYGGNPFATALIEALKHESLSLRALLRKVKATTAATSSGFQVPVWELFPGHGRWRLVNNAERVEQSRQALVLIVSAYDSTELGILPGAAVDERRVAAALALNGFSVIQGVGRDKSSIAATLRSFVKLTKKADVGVIYCTGHGAHTLEGTLLLPTDYPVQHGYSKAALKKYSVPISALREACQSKSMNLVFFAGCRTNVA